MSCIQYGKLIYMYKAYKIHAHVLPGPLQIGACDYPYPEMRLTDEELRILGRLSQPHPPVMDRTNALPHTLLAVNG